MVCPGVGRDGRSSFFFGFLFFGCSLSPSRSWLPIAGSSTLPDTRECCLSRLGTYSQHSSVPTPQPQSSPSTSLSSQFSLTPSPRSSHMISRSTFGFPFLTCSWTCYSALAFPGLQYDYSIFLPTQCPSPLSRYPVILLSRNTLYHPWTSPFLLHLENPPISDHMLLPSVSSHSYRWRASLIFPISALLCACALVLTLYLYLFFTEPRPPHLLPLFLRALLPIPTLTEPPTLTAPTVPPAHYSHSRPRYARFFSPPYLISTYSLSLLLFDADLFVLSWICQYQRSIRSVFPPPSLFLALISSLC